MSQSKLHQPTPGLVYSIVLVGGSLFSVLLFGGMIGILTTSVVNQSGVITRKRGALALLLMWIGTVGITIGTVIYFIKTSEDHIDD